MNYPVWEVPLLGGGMLIGIIAIVHVFIAHFAVGGGMFLPLTELKAYREKDPRILDYVKRHTLFFVLLTLVTGAVSGVGIWWTIGLVHPSATRTLLLVFVWVWATEWVMFFTEITAALVYYYGWNRLSPKTHLTVGWIYFASAWLSLFLINGILCFMLTPGKWLESRSLFHAFFNPTMLPSLFLRTLIAVALAGIFALFTATQLQPDDLREKMVKWAGKWLILPGLLMPLGLVWYLAVVPESARRLALGGAAPVLTVFVTLSLVMSVLIFAFSYLGAFKLPKAFSQPFAMLIMALAFLTTGMTEWVREAIRKPFVVYGYMFSNSIRAEEVRNAKDQSILVRAKWTTVPHVTHDNWRQSGRELFRLQCASCHTVDGYNGIRPLIYGWDESMIDSALQRLHKLRGFMPPFVGTEAERKALAKWLAEIAKAEAYNQFQ
ncbi:MAG: cytochrome ubiquinol oxidase subunit I [Armatimonadetes bacterium]|nr:cytochrome ubiquinol oxidase subunit I [Armatimonadota bacterium]MDW8029685.1 cytochrome ubiquinol oxidase subunit I [Armatimonadota bacterium]